MPQFFVKNSNIDEDFIHIDNKSDVKHISSVLRLNKNDELILIDEDQFTYKTKIIEISSQTITTKVIEKYKSNKKLNINISLAQSIIKSNAQDLVVQKATELGIHEIIPIATKHTVVKLKSQSDKDQKLKRWQKIASESCKQCERADIPKVDRVLSFDEIIKIKQDYNIVFTCVERNAELTIKQFLRENIKTISAADKLLVIIGPEGGWADSEIKAFRDNNITCVSLGNLILRAETASITALSDIIYEFEL